MQTKKLNNQQGFSILEVIGAMAIIILGMVGLISLSMQSIKIINFNKNALIASELAREGLELIINARDTNWLSGSSAWNAGFDTDGNYTMSYSSSTPRSLGGNINSPQVRLYIDSNGFYTHNGGQDSGFNRMITITSGGPASSTIDSLIQYNDRGAVKQYKLETVLYNWY